MFGFGRVNARQADAVTLDAHEQRDGVAVGHFNHAPGQRVGLGGQGWRGDQRQAKCGEKQLDRIHQVAPGSPV